MLSVGPLSEDSPRTVLVTGASGLLGWPLCLELARRGHTVLMMVRRNRRRNVRERVDAISPRSLGRRLKILVGDLNEDGLFDTRTRNRANKADTVIHCAGLTDPAVDRTLAYRTHVEGTAALLAFAADLNCPQMRGYISSAMKAVFRAVKSASIWCLLLGFLLSG